MQMIKFILAALIIAFAGQAGAQVQQARGQFSLNYKDAVGVFDRKEAPPAVRQKARQEAVWKALQAYYAEAGQSESSNFESIRDKVASDPGHYILDNTVISESDNPRDFQYTVVVRISLDVAALRNAVQAGSAIGRAAEGEKSMMTFVFVSRQVDSTKSYDDRIYKRQDNSAQVAVSGTQKDNLREKTSEGESIGKSQIGTSGSSSRELRQDASASAKSTVTSETGGSTVRRASESTWRLLPSAGLNLTFTDRFAQAGYDVVDAAMVESAAFHVADIENDYKSGNDVQPKTLRAMAAGMKESAIPYVALGTLDVGLADKDPQTGLMRVAVTVSAKVWDVTKPIPRTRTAVGPVAYAGTGPTEEEARGNALQLAARSAAQELSSRMVTMGLH